MVISKIARKVGSAIVSSPDKSRIARAGFEFGKRSRAKSMAKASESIKWMNAQNAAHIRRMIQHNKNIQSNIKLQHKLSKDKARMEVLKAREISRIKILEAHKMMLIRKQKAVDLAKIRKRGRLSEKRTGISKRRK